MSLSFAALQKIGRVGSLPTFTALARQINAEPEDEQRQSGQYSLSPQSHELQLSGCGQ